MTERDVQVLRVDAAYPPPRWALLQRKLLADLEQAGEEFVARYTRSDGTLIWRDEWPGMDGSDDPYEAFQNLVLLYTLGGSERMLELGERMWEKITWQWTHYGQIHDEFDAYYDWMHHGESSHLLYFTGLANPGSLIWKQRAAKFADLYTGMPNYDPEHKIIRSPLTGSRGPRFTVTAEDWVTHRPVFKRCPFEDVPGGMDTEFPWLDESRFAQILERFNQRVSRGDVPLNLNATTLAAHAFMFTGDARYRDWIVEYVSTWQDRTRVNGGVVPDNIGLDGEVGAYNDGKWWGGYYGWSWPHGLGVILDGLTNGAVAAALVTGEPSFLDLPRMQIDVSWKLRRAGEDGAWLLPAKHFDSGWGEFKLPPHVQLVQLWNVSMSDADADRIDRLNLPEAWREVVVPKMPGSDPALGRGTKHMIANTLAWHDYIRGRDSGYPDAILDAGLAGVAQQLDRMRSPAGDPRNWDLDHPMSIHMWQAMSPLMLEGLAQLTLGAPMHLSHGGLQHARFRYYDAAKRRPGLPRDTAALVTSLSSDAATLELVNISPCSAAELVVQAGGFGEHEMTRVEAHTRDGQLLQSVPDAGQWLRVWLGSGAGVRLDVSMRRYAHPPSYATPWTDPFATPMIRPRDQNAEDVPLLTKSGAYGLPV